MSRIWWVRHGPTHQKAFAGWRDVPADLSDVAALSRIDAFLPRDAAIVSSDLGRARTTADRIAGGRERLPDLAGLREFNFGTWDGLRFDEVARDHPELSRVYWEDPGDHAPPEGESWNAASARVASCVHDLLAGTDRADIVAVAHIGVILTQVQRALSLSPAEILAQPIEPLSVTCLALEDGRWTARMVNHRP